MEKERIKYYGFSDLYLSSALQEIDKLLHSDFLKVNNDINDIIEFFIITKYFNEGLIDRCNKEKILKKEINLYIANIKNVSLSELYQNVISDYKEDFWDFFSYFIFFDTYTDDSLSVFLNDKRPYIKYILQNRKIVFYYDQVIKKYFLSNPDNATLLIDEFECNDEYKIRKKLYLPNSINSEDCDNIIYQYLNSNSIHISYLELIVKMRNREKFRISNKTRLFAKRKLEKERNLFFQKSTEYQTKISIKYIENQEREIILDLKNGIDTCISYSLDWIKNNKDYSTLLNNFIYLFEFTDETMRINLTSRKSDTSPFEQIVKSSSKYDYNENWSFSYKNDLSNLQLISYISILKNENIHIEDIIYWFFTDYIKEQFGIENYNINCPSKKTNYIEKCRIIAPEFETILKKFNIFVENKYIDTELLELTSIPFSFSDCKSLFKIKNIYPNPIIFDKISYYFFSDQSTLKFHPSQKQSYKNFYYLVNSERIEYSSYSEYNKEHIDWLIENNFLFIENGFIHISDKDKMLIIHDLYRNEYINYINYTGRLKNKLDELISENIIYYDSCLLSQCDLKYFSYILNKSEFCNSLDLRNRYLHGTQSSADSNSQEHQLNYIYFIKVIILLVIKINDELCCFFNKNIK